METKERISVFEYRQRKAQAEADFAAAQQEVFAYLIGLGYKTRWAEDAAESGLNFIGGGDMSEEELTAVNSLLAKVRQCNELIHEIESSTTIY